MCTHGEAFPPLLRTRADWRRCAKFGTAVIDVELNVDSLRLGGIEAGNVRKKRLSYIHTDLCYDSTPLGRFVLPYTTRAWKQEFSTFKGSVKWNIIHVCVCDYKPHLFFPPSCFQPCGFKCDAVCLTIYTNELHAANKFSDRLIRSDH